MSKDEFMRMHDWLLINGLCRPGVDKDPTKPYYPVPRSDPNAPPVTHIGYRDMFMRTTGKAMRQLGASDAEVEERWRNYIKSFNG